MDLRAHALAIFHAGLEAADPAEAIRRAISIDHDILTAAGTAYPLPDFQRIFLLGAGKASAPMAQAVEDLLGPRLTAGALNVKHGHGLALSKTELTECGHPLPDEDGVLGAKRIARLASEAGEHDLVIVVISGGASALLPLPADPVTLEEKQELTRLLLRSGADIYEMNVVRKHLSAIKGGQLARLAAPAKVLCLLLSDVIGDDLGVIGSGPAAPDPSTFQDALEVLRRRSVYDEAPESIRRRLNQGAAGQIPETPKPGDPLFARVQNLIVGSNLLALEAAAKKAEELGYKTLTLSSSIAGETRDVAGVHAAIAREIRSSGRPLPPPACLLSGGETTVTIKGEGKGGRNQEFALAAALEIAGLQDILILSAGTDGTDGPTDAAGALATGDSPERARALGLDAADALRRNDSYPFFDRLGDLIKTGPTRTNVMDLRIVLTG